MKSKVFVSVVSHNQEDLITKYFKNYPKQIGDFELKLAVLDNTGSYELEEFCKNEKIFYHKNKTPHGFGENHNIMFNLLNPADDDIFVVSDPDINADYNKILGFFENFKKNNLSVATPRSYLDKEKNILDFPDRYFPYLANFFISILTGKRLHYGSNLAQQHPEWISGSYMVFKGLVYRDLKGFDESFFMYCEDIDICYRAYEKGYKIFLDTSHFIEHDSRMDSRKFFSKTIWMHIKTAFKYSKRANKLIGLKVAK